MLNKIIDLCGLWRFQPDPSEEGEKVGYFDSEYDAKLWREVFIPCDFGACLPNLAIIVKRWILHRIG